MKKVLSVLLAGCLLLVAGCSDGYEDTLKSANRNYRNGNYQEAKQQYEQISKNSSNSQVKREAEEALKDYDAKVEKIEKATQTFINDYHSVMINYWSPLYSSCSVGSNFYTLVIEVNPYWYSLNKEQKENVIMRMVKLYNGMLVMRDVKLDLDYLDVYFKDSTTGVTVGTWGSILGPSVDK